MDKLSDWSDDQLWESLPDAASAELVARLESRIGNLEDELAAVWKRAAELEATNKWRPVTDPPTDGGIYIVCWVDDPDSAAMEEARYWPGANMWFSTDSTGQPIDPTHYLIPPPLPFFPPPTGGDS